jgi:transposase
MAEAQQVVLALHRLRAQLMKMRIMQTNEIRGLMYEFGIVMSEGHRTLLKELPAALLEAKSKLPAMFIDCIDEQVRGSTISRETSPRSSGGSRSICANRPPARRRRRSQASGS